VHQSVLVTGASSGIGEETAVFLAHKGFRIFAAARRTEKLKELTAVGAGRITPVEMDVTDEASIAAALKAIAGEGVILYGLVNNAGVSVMGPFEKVPLSEWRRQYETNVFGLVAVTQAVLPQMRKAGRGRIVNIGSLAGRIASPLQGVYASSKHAVEGLSDALRRELVPYGVKVSVVRPGFINTPFGNQEQDGLDQYATDDVYGEQLQTFKAWHARGHPNAPSPVVVAEAVHHALTAERPHSRYTAPAKMLGALTARNLLPSAISDRVLERVNGLDKFRK
jgi:NAD(P)-dependent dehydrogenase (short-subunit alcohol dehydrogenase family)